MKREIIFSWTAVSEKTDVSNFHNTGRSKLIPTRQFFMFFNTSIFLTSHIDHHNHILNFFLIWHINFLIYLLKEIVVQCWMVYLQRNTWLSLTVCIIHITHGVQEIMGHSQLQIKCSQFYRRKSWNWFQNF